jgi:polycomb protein SCMH1
LNIFFSHNTIIVLLIYIYFKEKFDWTSYLKRHNAEAAPASCFFQHEEPPVNEFKVGNKLETYDPRNTSSTCIGTVIEINGPRMRLRLDGTDDRNDFWLMVDSDLIHPFQYSARHGRKIQPPLGFGNDLSKWPKFLEKILQSTSQDVFAAESCFKKPPSKPQKNEFKVGQKLEAVDPKNPHLICPATIKEIKRDKLYLSFDGWSQSSQFWCSFLSRDLFPCGWCMKAGHTLQLPGNLEEKRLAHSIQHRSSSISGSTPSAPVAAPSNAIIANSAKSNIVANKSKKQLIASTNDKIISNTNRISTNSLSSSDNSSNNLNITNDTLNNTPPVSSLQQIGNAEAKKTEKNINDDNKIDLSIVKSEAIDPFEINDKSNAENNTIPLLNNIGFSDSATNGSCKNEKTAMTSKSKNLTNLTNSIASNGHTALSNGINASKKFSKNSYNNLPWLLLIYFLIEII